MAKRKKASELFSMARITGENIGKLMIESHKHSRRLARTGRMGMERTAQALSLAHRKAEKAAKETMPQLIREFNKGLRKGMKKRR